MDELALAAHVDQAGIDQFLEMVRQGGGADGQIAAHVAAGQFLAAGNAGQDLVAARVGQRLADAMELLGGHDKSV